jgi:hypothetical protein
MKLRLTKMLRPNLAALVLCFVAQSQAEPANQLKQTAGGPLARQLRSLILRQVEFRDANLAGVLEYLRQKAAEQSRGTIDAVYLLAVPDEVALSNAVTLSLTNIPFLEALRYIGELAGVNLRIQNNVIVAELHDTSFANIRDMLEDPGKTSKAPILNKGLSGPLARAAEPGSTGGGHVYRTTNGEIQNSKSGYIKHRSSGGWPMAIDLHNTADVNCSERAGCRSARHSPACPMRVVPDTVQSSKPN